MLDTEARTFLTVSSGKQATTVAKEVSYVRIPNVGDFVCLNSGMEEEALKGLTDSQTRRKVVGIAHWPGGVDFLPALDVYLGELRTKSTDYRRVLRILSKGGWRPESEKTPPE